MQLIVIVLDMLGEGGRGNDIHNVSCPQNVVYEYNYLDNDVR